MLPLKGLPHCLPITKKVDKNASQLEKVKFRLDKYFTNMQAKLVVYV